MSPPSAWQTQTREPSADSPPPTGYIRPTPLGNGVDHSTRGAVPASTTNVVYVPSTSIEIAARSPTKA
jgi:hypothetical protein